MLSCFLRIHRKSIFRNVELFAKKKIRWDKKSIQNYNIKIKQKK